MPREMCQEPWKDVSEGEFLIDLKSSFASSCSTQYNNATTTKKKILFLHHRSGHRRTRETGGQVNLILLHRKGKLEDHCSLHRPETGGRGAPTAGRLGGRGYRRPRLTAGCVEGVHVAANAFDDKPLFALCCLAGIITRDVDLGAEQKKLVDERWKLFNLYLFKVSQ